MKIKEAKSSIETKFVENYLENLAVALSDVHIVERVHFIVEILLEAYRYNRAVFVFGNGGSASTASHFCCDLAKGTIGAQEKRLKVICLNDSVPLVTAWANDVAYSKIFVEQLKNYLQKGDVVIGISGSGNSSNVIEAVDYANEHSAFTIGLTGYEGGILRFHAQLSFIVCSDNMQRIEDVHLIVCHMVSLLLKQGIKNEVIK